MSFLFLLLLATGLISVNGYVVTVNNWSSPRPFLSSSSSSRIRRSQLSSAIPSENYSDLSSTSTAKSATTATATAAPNQAENYQDCVSWDYKQVCSAVFQEDKRPIMLFDGECNLCSKSVNFMLDHDHEGHFRFVSLQSRVGKSLLVRSNRHPEDTSTIVVCHADGSTSTDSDSVVLIAKHLDGPWLPRLGRIGEKIPKFIRDGIYHVVANNRHVFGKHNHADQCRMDFDGHFTDRFVQDPDEETL